MWYLVWRPAFNATIRHPLKNYRLSNLVLVEQLVDSIYVDDVITGTDKLEVAYQLDLDSKKILKEEGFNLR